MSKRTRSSVYNNSESDSSYSEDDSGDDYRGGSTNSNKKIRPLSKDQLYQLWTSFVTSRPSHESDRATARALSKSNNYKMYTPRQISKKISYLKTLYKTKTPSSATTTSAAKNESDGEYQVESYNYDDFEDDDDEEEDDEDGNYSNDNINNEDIEDDDNQEDNGNANGNGTRVLVWDEETDLELLKLIKQSRHLFPSDVAFTDHILKEKKFSKDRSHSQIKRRVSRLRHKHNIATPPPPPKPKKPIPEESRLKELKDKLQKYENENKGLKKQVGTLENKVSDLNQIIEKEDKEEKLSVSTKSSVTPYSIHLNDNTEITSSSSAVKIKSASYNDDIYILFPSFNGGNTKLRIVEIVGNRCHVEIKHVNTTFVNISNHFIKSIPGYHNPVSCLIKHNGINNTGLLLKRIIPNCNIK